MLSAMARECQESCLSSRKHSSCATGTVIAGVCCIFDLVFNGIESKVCHELYNVTRRPVLAGLLVVFFVKSAD